MQASGREHAWFANNPERLAEQDARDQTAAAWREQEEMTRLSRVRSPDFAEYRDVAWRSRLARGWLFVSLVLSVVGAALEVSHLNLIHNVSTAGLDFELANRIDASTGRIGIVYLLEVCAFFFTAVFFISWTYRAYQNAAALGAQERRFGAGWAIGGWFVPILSLWRPKQIVDDIWRMSDPNDPPVVLRHAWRERSVPWVLSVWWGLFIVGSFVDRLGASQADPYSVEADRVSTSWALVGSILSVAGAAVAIRIVGGLTTRQRERAAAIEALPVGAGPSDSPPTAATAPAT
jgi:hypothetical protein